MCEHKSLLITDVIFLLSYRYLGMRLESSETFKFHVEQLVQKLKIKMGFLYQNKHVFLLKQENLCAVKTLKHLDAVYHCGLCFISGDNYRTHQCVLYEKVVTTREQYIIAFIYVSY